MQSIQDNCEEEEGRKEEEEEPRVRVSDVIKEEVFSEEMSFEELLEVREGHPCSDGMW